MAALPPTVVDAKMASLLWRQPTRKAHREAGAPIGVELSITVCEPKANPRTGLSLQWDPIGVQLPITAGKPQTHPRTTLRGHPPRPQATHPCARTTSG